MIQIQGDCVPDELKPRNVERQFYTCKSCFTGVLGDKKWIHYKNTKKRKSWSPHVHALTLKREVLPHLQYLPDTTDETELTATSETTRLFSCMIMSLHMSRCRLKPSWEDSIPATVFTRHLTF